MKNSIRMNFTGEIFEKSEIRVNPKSHSERRWSAVHWAKTLRGLRYTIGKKLKILSL